MAAGNILVATQSFVLWVGGRMVRFRRNRTTIREGHPYLEGNEQRFKPFLVDFELGTDGAPQTKAPAVVAPPAPPAPEPPELETEEQKEEAAALAKDNNREALNALGAQVGVDTPEAYETKAALAAAIVVAKAD